MSRIKKNICLQSKSKTHVFQLLYKLVCVYFLLISVGTNAQISNNSFEQWSNSNGYFDPLNWGTLNEFTNPYSVFTCARLSPGNPGNYYLSVRTVSITGKGLVPGRIVSGKIDTITYKPLSGFPCSLRPAYLSYDMQYMVASPSDTAYVSVLLTKWNTLDLKRDTIAYGNSSYNSMMHQWTTYSTYLNYLSGDSPDSACIVISSSRYAPLQNSYVYIDNLNFNGSVIGIAEHRKSEILLNAFPNPFENILNFDFSLISYASQIEILIYSSYGELYHSTNKIEGTSFRLNTSHWPSGVYFAVIKNSSNQITKKIIK